MSLKAIDVVAAPVTKMDAFRLYALHKRFKITTSQKALDRLQNFQNIIVEKAVNSKVVARQDGGAVSLSFKSDISYDFISLDMTAGQFLDFKKQVSTQISMLFTKESDLPLVYRESPSERIISESKGQLASEEFFSYQKILYSLQQIEKSVTNTSLNTAALYAAICVVGTICVASASQLAFGMGFAALGYGLGAGALAVGISALLLSAKRIRDSFSLLAIRIDGAAMETAMTSAFKKL